jgi:hypothetical protein
MFVALFGQRRALHGAAGTPLGPAETPILFPPYT